jgi:hypothetical protein
MLNNDFFSFYVFLLSHNLHKKKFRESVQYILTNADTNNIYNTCQD